MRKSIYKGKYQKHSKHSYHYHLELFKKVSVENFIKISIIQKHFGFA